jgi:hypothetical protein
MKLRAAAAAGVVLVAAAAHATLASAAVSPTPATSSNWAGYVLSAPAVPIKMKIAAGDTITTAVVANGTTVTLQITNRTRHTRFTKTVSVPSPDLTSAEWIAEAPSLCATSGRCRVVPLANFGAVRFTSAAATANAHPGVITDDTWTALPVQLQAGDGRPFGGFFGSTGGALTGNALPGVVSADGRAFSVAWQASAASVAI